MIWNPKGTCKAPEDQIYLFGYLTAKKDALFMFHLPKRKFIAMLVFPLAFNSFRFAAFFNLYGWNRNFFDYSIHGRKRAKGLSL